MLFVPKQAETTKQVTPLIAMEAGNFIFFLLVLEPVSPPSTEDSVVGNQQVGSTEEESIVTGLPKKILRHRKKKVTCIDI